MEKPPTFPGPAFLHREKQAQNKSALSGAPALQPATLKGSDHSD
jgi:hypothetical protein